MSTKGVIGTMIPELLAENFARLFNADVDSRDFLAWLNEREVPVSSIPSLTVLKRSPRKWQSWDSGNRLAIQWYLIENDIIGYEGALSPKAYRVPVSDLEDMPLAKYRRDLSVVGESDK